MALPIATANSPRTWRKRFHFGPLARLEASALRLQRGFPDVRLPIEPVPESCWLVEVCDYLARPELDRIRLAALTESTAHCVFCRQQPSDLATLRVASRWEFLDATLTQRLAAIVAVCSPCHQARWELGGLEPSSATTERARTHLAQTNHWALDRVEAYVQAAHALARQRATQEWSLDLDWLRSMGLVLPVLHPHLDLDQTYLPGSPYQTDRSVQVAWKARVTPLLPTVPEPGPGVTSGGENLSTSRRPSFSAPANSDRDAYARTERIPVEVDLGDASVPLPEIPPELGSLLTAVQEDAVEAWRRLTEALGPRRELPEPGAFLDGEIPAWKLWAYLEPRARLEPAFLLHLVVRVGQRALTALLLPWRTTDSTLRTNLPEEAQRILPGLPIWRDAFFLYETARFRSARRSGPAVRLVTSIARLSLEARRALRDLRRLDRERLRLCGESVELELRTRFALVLPGSLHERAEAVARGVSPGGEPRHSEAGRLTREDAGHRPAVPAGRR